MVIICDYIALKLLALDKLSLYLPRIQLCPSDPTIVFKLRKRQFPTKIAFAITINKAEGQTFKRAGVYVRWPDCYRDPLYVSFSRSSSFDNIAVAVIEGRRQDTEIGR